MPKQYPVLSTPELTDQLKTFAGEHFNTLDESIQFLLARRPRSGLPIEGNIRCIMTEHLCPVGNGVIFYEFIDGEAVYLRSLQTPQE